MTDRADSPLGRARRAASKVGEAADTADGLFTRVAGQLEKNLVSAAAGLCTRAAGVVPFVARSASRAVYHFGKESEPLAAETSSLVISCVPAAAYRTAAIVDHLGETFHGLAINTVESVLGAPSPTEDHSDDDLREMGRDVASYVDVGLDAFSVGLSLRTRAGEIRRLRRERWRARQQQRQRQQQRSRG